MPFFSFYSIYRNKAPMAAAFIRLGVKHLSIGEFISVRDYGLAGKHSTAQHSTPASTGGLAGIEVAAALGLW